VIGGRVFIFEDVCRTSYIFPLTDLKMLNKCSRPTHICSVIMHICISGVSAANDIIPMQWLHHQWEMVGDNDTLRFRVGLFRRM
jgi:hypothetical protein